MSVFNQIGRCCECGAEFPLHTATQRFLDVCPTESEIELDLCPECGSYSVEDAAMCLGSEDAVEDTCTVVFRLSKTQMSGGEFLYALACRTEGWAGVEVLRVQLPDQCYEAAIAEVPGHD
ncbi:hypothetical protein I5R92_09475 [Pseudomonas carnis]|uniref:hypothetical protein n=1 Tax=Pseudomonas carnis TaxID=2487355 RepID=UPI0018D8AEB5|nr:hypothetical protein [Pseudomonas carnis]MBH3367510.1 hypothetical protein [Pseudomonas carnis]